MSTPTHAHSEEAIEEARQLRRDGLSYRQISAATGISLEPLSRFLRDIPKPDKKPEPITPTEYQERVDNERRADRRRNVVTDDDDYQRPSLKPRLTLPEPGEYPANNDGTMKQALIDYADLQLGLYLDAVEAGHLYDQQPTTFMQAWLIYLHSWRPHEKAWFQQNRPEWRRIREGTSHKLEDFATPIGVSVSTIRRWELNERTPDRYEAARLQQQLVQAQEREIARTELNLAKRDVFDADGSEQLTGPDLIHDLIGADNWDRGDECTDNGEGFTINHLPSLKTARALIPHPNWRHPNHTNWWLTGHQDWPGSIAHPTKNT